MTKSKVADAKISAEARKTVEEERRRRSAGITAAESCHAAQQTVSLWAGGELEFQRWYGNSKTRFPAWFWDLLKKKKKKARAENISRVYVKPKNAALSETNGVWSETSTKESRAAESKLFLRFAPKAALMASVLGNNSRASGAQSGQVKCKLKRRRRRRSKRKGTTLQLLPLYSLHSVSRDRAHLGERLSARCPDRPRAALPFRAATQRRFSSANLAYLETALKNDSYLDAPSAWNCALSRTWKVWLLLRSLSLKSVFSGTLARATGRWNYSCLHLSSNVCLWRKTPCFFIWSFFMSVPWHCRRIPWNLFPGNTVSSIIWIYQKFGFNSWPHFGGKKGIKVRALCHLT